ncbi:cilia- and flagella-associated protein 184 [Odontesthes bonariensis]|uniref:cilia- and flagella-associated protein 184 n=1 Tax=Odontesthes bonariensis TaxID=219752 RepID=UPI003F5891E3
MDKENDAEKETLEENNSPIDQKTQSHDLSVDFEIGSTDDNEPLGLNPETPKRETPTPAQEEEEEATAGAENKEDICCEGSILQLLQELCKQRDEASQQSRQLQMKLAEYLSKRTRDDSQLGREKPVTDQLQEYEKYINILNDLKQQLCADSESAQRQAEELRSQSQDKLEKVEDEWRALVALKRDAAVTALSRHLGKEAAQAEVEAVLTAEQLREDELTKTCLKHFKLRLKIRRLEAELRDAEKHGGDPLQIQFEQLQAERLEQKKQAEKESEESLKLQRKISSCLEVLSSVKEKLHWSQMEVKGKRERLEEVEAMLARKRDLLTRTKKARNSLQKDNLRLKERRGLLGNRVLLRDFEDTVEASDHLEKHLESLKSQEDDIIRSCGRWRKKTGDSVMTNGKMTKVNV